MKKYLWSLLLGSFLWSFNGWGQAYQRLSGDFIIKGKNFDSTYQLTRGRFYYDRRSEKLLLRLSFPYRELYVFHDTSVYHFIDSNGQWLFHRRSRSPILPRLSPYGLLLEGKMTDFGLNKLGYKIDKIEKQDSLVVSTWNPPWIARKVLGRVRVATHKGRLFGVVFYDGEGNLRAKQFYEDYRPVKGLYFPHRIVQLTYQDEKEAIQVTTYQNVIVDEKDNDRWYDYQLPAAP